MLPMSCLSEGKLREDLFGQQVERLIERGYHEALGKSERDFRFWLDLLRINRLEGRLLNGVGETDLNNLPFLIVIPHAMFPIVRQMRLLVFGKKQGYASLDDEKFTNWEGLGSSKCPYLACDVDDGAGNVGRVTAEVATEIRRACRHGLTFEEGIALAVHSPRSLAHHAFALIDTDYQSDPRPTNEVRRQCVPELWLGSDGPTQNYSYLRSQREDRGVPSCSRRLLLDR